MPAKVRIPAPLRKLTKEQPVVDVQGKTVDEVLADLEKKYPGIKERICDENGQIRRFINVFVNGEDIRFKDGAKTAVADGAEISIIPAIAGGATDVSEYRSMGVSEKCPDYSLDFTPIPRYPQTPIRS